MGTIKVVTLINEALTILHDTGVRWPKTQVLEWFNNAQREVCLLKPEALAVNESFALTVGQAKQTIPAGGISLIEVVADLTTNKGIRITDRDTLDVHIPDWRSQTGDVEQYIYDLRDPKTFYVYPHAAAAKSVEIIYAKSPDQIVIADFDTDVQVIEVDDIYSNSIVNYILHRAYIKDTKTESQNKGVLFYKLFQESLGQKTNIDSMIHPKRMVKDSGGN